MNKTFPFNAPLEFNRIIRIESLNLTKVLDEITFKKHVLKRNGKRFLTFKKQYPKKRKNK